MTLEGGGQHDLSPSLIVVSDLQLETKDSWFKSGCYLCVEVSSLQ